MILLTGGAGFIGSVMLNKLNREGIDDVFVVDNLRNGNKWKNLVGKKYESYSNKKDFRNDYIAMEFGSCDAIIHLGACSATTERDADYLMDNNYNYSKDLAYIAAEYDIPFIYASSAATYGEGEHGYSDEIFEPLTPINCYGYSKHAFDMWVIKNGLDSKFIGLKFFNVFGPNEYSKGDMRSMVSKAYEQILETGRLNLFKSNSPEFEDGEQMRDFIYVKDAVDIIWEFIKKPEITGIFNVGTGKARSWNDLANAVFASMDRESKIDYIDMPEKLIGQYQNFTEADTTKITKAGITHKPLSLEESVDDYVKNYLMKGYKRI